MKIVEEFQLPPRHLPAECGAGALLAVADGPSLSDYELTELQSCGATLCGYGRSAALLQLEHYWIWDYMFLETLKDIQTIPAVYAHPLLYERRHECPQHGWQLATADCRFNVAVETRKLRPALPLFLCGLDGYFLTTGELRRGAQHAHGLPLTERIRALGGEAGYGCPDTEEYRTQQMHTALTLALGRLEPAWNLSVDSAYRVCVPVHPDVLAQPYGQIRRTGPALLIDCRGVESGSDPWRPAPQPVEFHRGYLAALRVAEPTLAICAIAAPHQAERLAVYCDELQIPVVTSARVAATSRFSAVSMQHLPGIQD